MEKSKFLFILAVFGYRSEVVTFFEGLEITYQSIFLFARSHNTMSVKKNIEKYRKIEIFVFCRRLWISVESSQILLKVLKLPINAYFCPPDRIILSGLKKNKEKSKIFFYVVGF